MHLMIRFLCRRFLPLAALLIALPLFAATPPQVGDEARNFTLGTLTDQALELKSLTAKRPVLLVVLRGWPGYQCPICTRQVHDFASHAAEVAKRDVQVLMVYPGPAEQLKAHAQEFLQDKQWPADWLFVIDPDFAFTNAYGLRWDAPRETAYPSTFIIDRDNRVRYAHVSHTHGDRVGAQAALDAIATMKK